MFGFRINVDLTDIADFFDGPLLTPAELREIANQALFFIDKNTSEGRDANRRKFKPYSKKYQQKRVKAGRNTFPDMMFTGQMLGALIAGSEGGDTAIVHFSSQSEAQKAEYHISDAPRSKIPLRDFLHLNPEKAQMRALSKQAAEFVAVRFNNWVVA